jgi:hypothetical protein
MKSSLSQKTIEKNVLPLESTTMTTTTTATTPTITPSTTNIDTNQTTTP